MASAAPVHVEVAPGDPIGALLLKLRRRDRLSEKEAEVLRGAVACERTIPPGEVFISSGQQLEVSTLLVEGLACRFKTLAQGQRQITELHVAGDFIDLHGFLLKQLEHDVAALTPVRVAYVPHERLKRITETEPHLTRLLWLSTLMDAAIQRERILSVGRRSALARIAHLFCELQLRLDAVGELDGASFRLPVTQLDLAHATGLTSVHVNRMLRQLRDQKLVTFRTGMVEIHDLPRLQEAAEFDPAYLYLQVEPR